MAKEEIDEVRKRIEEADEKNLNQYWEMIISTSEYDQDSLLNSCLEEVGKLKRGILRLVKDKKEAEKFFNDLEKTRIDLKASFIPRNKRLRNAPLLRWIYFYIRSALLDIQGGRVEKRKKTTAERYWKKREKFEEKAYERGKDPQITVEGSSYAPKYNKGIIDEYPFPYYPPSRDHTKGMTLINRFPGRPEKMLNHFLRRILSDALRRLLPPPKSVTACLEKILQLLPKSRP